MLMIFSLIVAVVTGLYVFVDGLFLSRQRLEASKFVEACEIVFILSVLLLMVEWYNFEFALTMAVVLSGIIFLFDKLFLAKRRERRSAKRVEALGDTITESQKTYLTQLPLMVDYARSFFGVLLLVLVIRSCLFSPFRIPSGSLEPSLLIGDYIIVNKFAYGIRVPVLNKTIIPVSEPKRGDIVVVHWPPKPRVDFIKRMIGLPGDTVSYVDRVLTINGKEIHQDLIKHFNYIQVNGETIPASQKEENLLGVKHGIYIIPGRSSADYHDIVVPEGMYFIMGDNRDDSEDGRYWGFVSEDQLVGKAEYIVLNWNSAESTFRWHRFFKKVH
jgi:signal peptidase I